MNIVQNRRSHDQPTPIMHHVMTPIELSKMKSDQERQLQTALLEQRQAAVLAFQGHRVKNFFGGFYHLSSDI